MAESEELEQLRQRIDRIDKQIQDLINERVALAISIARLKQTAGDGSFYRPEREAQILRTVTERNRGPLRDKDMARLFREIMSATLAAEAPTMVAFLGPQGTYTQDAAIKHFGHSVGTIPLATIEEVFGAVEREQANFGVVPVENSTEGVVTHTLDGFVDSPLQICGEVVLRIRHQLLTKAGSLAEVNKVYSHIQSLAQCRRWRAETLPDVATAVVASNAEAARLASQEPTAAAIASAAAGEIYDVPSVAADIEDHPGNTTRFLVIGQERPGPSGRDKTSLLVSSRNRPGALHRLLSPLAARDVSLTRIESRPARSGLWEYVFFIDIEGHVEDENIRAALGELESEAAFMKLLGAYPRAVL
jgi:chorismate mutase/prephenate dehydratase